MPYIFTESMRAEWNQYIHRTNENIFTESTKIELPYIFVKKMRTES